MLRDRDLLKFVFGKPPADVRRTLDSFSREVAEALLLPVSVNVYDAQFHAKADGSLDYSATGSCFQVVGQAEAYDLADMEVLLQDEQNDRLQKIYEKYHVQGVQVSLSFSLYIDIHRLPKLHSMILINNLIDSVNT